MIDLASTFRSTRVKMTDSSYAKSIELPTDQIFKHLKDAKRFAIDIGKDNLQGGNFECGVSRLSKVLYGGFGVSWYGGGGWVSLIFFQIC